MPTHESPQVADHTANTIAELLEMEEWIHSSMSAADREAFRQEARVWAEDE